MKLHKPRCGVCEKKAKERYVRADGKLWHDWQRQDYYGLPTGTFCDKCYKSDDYPYRRDDYYDPAYAGERMDEDY